MSIGFDEVFDAARELPEGDRVRLIDELIGTLAPEDAVPLDDSWLAEIDRRSSEFDAGGVTTVPWSVVRERSRQRLQSHG